jgi:hypothetical protein
MVDFSDITKTQARLRHGDGSFSDYVTLRLLSQGLHFHDIDQSDPLVKLKDIAHLRYVKARQRGESQAVVIALLRLERDQPAGKIFPGLSHITESGEELLSANSFITYTMRVLLGRGWLRFEKGTWRVATPKSERVWRQRAEAVIRLLTSQHRLHIELGPGRLPPGHLAFDEFPLDVYKNLIPVGRCGFLSDVVSRQRPRLVFNTAFFLLEHDDFFSHHSALGEAYNLWVKDGLIQRPPLYRRGGIFGLDNGRWRVGFCALSDVGITLPNGLQLLPNDIPLPVGTIPYTLNDEGPSDLTLYTRYYGVASGGLVLGHTPKEAGRFELTVVDRQTVGWKTGGNLALPQNGFVISFAPGVLSPPAQSEFQKTLQARSTLDYHFARSEHKNIVQAMQVGPILLQDGRSPLTNTYLEDEEQFWPSRLLDNGEWRIGVVSTDFATDVDRTRHGRVGLGIDRAGNLVLVMVAGVRRGLEVPSVDSDGATLAELTNLLAEAGAVDAVNLDGGGSTQAYYHGGQAVVPGDRRGQPQVHYERMVPSVGIVF